MADRLPPHAIVQFRECPVCRRTLAMVYREFQCADEVRRWIESDRPEDNIPVLSLPCPQCDKPGDDRPATHIALYVDGEMVGPPTEMGSWSLPMAGPGASGPVVLSPEELAAEDAAHYVFSHWPLEVFAELIEAYATSAVSSGRHRSAWRRWDARAWQEVLAEAGLDAPASEVECRRLAEGRAREVMEAWIRVLVRRIQRVGLRVWAERALEECDPWTVEFVLSGIPLPEGLESVRTEALGRLVRRPEQGEAALWRRLRSLQGELDRARSRAAELSRRLEEERRLRAEQEKKIASLSGEVRRLRDELATAAQAAKPGISRREEWKGLIDELRARVKELERKLGEEASTSPVRESPTPAPAPAPDEEALLRRLAGKTVAVVGGPWSRFPDGDWPYRVVHWDGWREEGLERAVSEADVVVVVSNHVSHRAYWAARAEALYQEKPLALTDRTHPRLVLLAAARCVGEGGAGDAGAG
ncbi:MAG: hypothetical protein AB1816_05390 [Bacillota bacterium]